MAEKGNGDTNRKSFPDGRFIDHGVLDKELTNPYFDHPRALSGAYSIQNQTMIFKLSRSAGESAVVRLPSH